MSSIVIVEGPTCVGKSSLVDVLSSRVALDKCDSLFVPPIFGDINGCIPWSDPSEGWVEYMTLASLWKIDCNIILDRGMLSWCLYNGNTNLLYKWFEFLRNWNYSCIVCLMSFYDTIVENMDKKGELEIDKLSSKDKIVGEISGFKRLYEFVPDDLKIEYLITDYDKSWKVEIANIIGTER